MKRLSIFTLVIASLLIASSLANNMHSLFYEENLSVPHTPAQRIFDNFVGVHHGANRGVDSSFHKMKVYVHSAPLDWLKKQDE
jgi:hypothetical protein